MKNKASRGLGGFLYSEWIFPIKDYYFTIRRNEACFEIVMPLLISIFCTVIYIKKYRVIVALDGLADLIPTVGSILIGFTVMLITLLLTSSGENVVTLKKISTGKKLYGRGVTLFQGLLIQFSHLLFSEVFLLLLIFLYMFLKGGMEPSIYKVIILGLEIYLILHILFSILRGITSLYFSFFRQNNSQSKTTCPQCPETQGRRD